MSETVNPSYFRAVVVFAVLHKNNVFSSKIAGHIAGLRTAFDRRDQDWPIFARDQLDGGVLVDFANEAIEPYLAQFARTKRFSRALGKPAQSWEVVDAAADRVWDDFSEWMFTVAG